MTTTKFVAATLGAVTLATGAAGLVLPQAQAATTAHTTKATPVTAADLATVSDLQQTPTRHYQLQYFHKNTGDRAGWCQSAALKVFAPNVSYTRSYQAGRYHSATASIASFATHARAVQVATTLGKGLKGCSARLVKANPDLLTNYTEYNRSVVLPGGQVAWLQSLRLVDGESSIGVNLQTAVVATGTHVEVIAYHDAYSRSARSTDAVRANVTRAVRTLA